MTAFLLCLAGFILACLTAVRMLLLPPDVTSALRRVRPWTLVILVLGGAALVLEATSSTSVKEGLLMAGTVTLAGLGQFVASHIRIKDPLLEE